MTGPGAGSDAGGAACVGSDAGGAACVGSDAGGAACVAEEQKAKSSVHVDYMQLDKDI